MTPLTPPSMPGVQPVWDVIRALRAHDDESLNTRRASPRLGRQNQKLSRPGKIHLDVPAHIGTDFVDAFNAHLVDQTTASWEFWLGLLQRFAGRQGHAACRLLTRRMFTGWAVGETPADRVQAGQLTADRTARLKHSPAGAGTHAPTNGRKGLDTFAALSSVRRRSRAIGLSGGRLPARPVGGAQRVACRIGKLDADRVARLESLPGWVWKMEQWEEGFGYLCRFAKREGHVRVPNDHVEDGYRLHQWVAVQRRTYKIGKLAADRLALLDHSLGGPGTHSPTNGRKDLDTWPASQSVRVILACRRPTSRTVIGSANG